MQSVKCSRCDKTNAYEYVARYGRCNFCGMSFKTQRSDTAFDNSAFVTQVVNTAIMADIANSTFDSPGDSGSSGGFDGGGGGDFGGGGCSGDF